MTRIIAVLFTLLVAFGASAQVVQPVYIRPSKGATVVAGANLTSASLTPGWKSAVYDFTGFEAMLVYIKCNDVCGSVQLGVFGSLSKTGPFFGIQSPNSTLASINSTSYNYTVSNMAPYVQFDVSNIPAGISMTISFVPIPFNAQIEVGGSYVPGQFTGTAIKPVIIGGINNSNGVSNLFVDPSGRLKILSNAVTPVGPSFIGVTSVAPSQVHTSNATICSLFVVNTDTTDVYCGQSSLLAASQGIPLNAASAAGKAGGSHLFQNYGGDLFCRTAAGSTTVRIQPQSCY